MKDLWGNEIAGERKKDWTGNRHSAYAIIGASNHSSEERQSEDFYATDPKAVEMLLELESFSHRILEPSCGEGHISKVLESHGHEVDSRDLVYRGYGKGGMDFLQCQDSDIDADVVMNPPYSLAQEFVEKAMEVIGEGHKVAAFLKLTFLEGKNRKKMFAKFPPKVVYVSSSRLTCGKNGVEWKPSSICYSWFIWEKGFAGEPVIRWFN